MLIKEYFGDNNGREAKVLLTPKGYEIQLEQDGGKAERGQTIFLSESESLETQRRQVTSYASSMGLEEALLSLAVPSNGTVSQASLWSAHGQKVSAGTDSKWLGGVDEFQVLSVQQRVG